MGVTPAKEERSVCTHLSKRGTRYYFRRKIPIDLQAHYGREEIVRSLGTSDRKEAVRLCRAVGVEVDAEFEKVRASLVVPNAEPSPAPVRVNADDLASRLLADLRRGRDGEAAKGHQELEKFMDGARLSLEAAESSLRGDLGVRYANSRMEAMRNALRAFLTGDGSVREGMSTPAHSSVPTAPGNTSLHDLIGKWSEEKAPTARTVSEVRLAVDRFIEHVGDIPAQRVEPRHAVQFKDKLLAAGMTAATTSKQLRMLSIIMTTARENLLAVSNPFSGIKVHAPKNAKEKRLPFDLAALQKIFSSPVYAVGNIPKAGAGQAAFWLPLLALFSGARLEELAQLRPDDVAEEEYMAEDGTTCRAWVLTLTDSGDGQALKNEGSRRRFPVHPELIRLGFIEYAQAAKGRARIFDKLTPDRYGSEGGNWSKWFGRYLRNVIGVTDRRMVFHSFRHTFKEAARRAGVPEDVHDAITGHSGGGVARTYGGLSYPLPPLVEAMNRYRIPGLVLPEPEKVRR